MTNNAIDKFDISKISIITVPADDVCVPDLFAIWGKAMTYTYKESGKVKHGL